MMRTSKSFAARWGTLQLDNILPETGLQPRLHEIINAPFAHHAGGMFLEPLLAHTPGSSDALIRATGSLTGYEAYANKMHVEDFVDISGNTEHERLRVLLAQGTKAAIALSERLEREGRFRVLLVLDPESSAVILRFYARREEAPWGPGDPDEIPMAETLMIDTENQK